MRLPRKTSLGRSYRLWGSPAWVHGVVRRTHDSARLAATAVPAHQFVEFRVVFPRRLLRSTAGAQVRHGNGLGAIVGEEIESQRSYEHDRTRIDDAKRHLGRWLLVLLALGLLPALAVILGVWVLSGRERKTGYDREYEQAPPFETEPALVPPLLRQDRSAGSNEFTATLFDLIRRGRYRTTPVTTSRAVWGGLRREDVADLEVTAGDSSEKLSDFELPVARVVDAVIELGGERLSNFRDRIESDRTAQSKRFTSFKKSVAEAIGRRGWCVNSGVGRLVAAALAFAGALFAAQFRCSIGRRASTAATAEG